MVCVPCFIIPLLLYIWHKFVQPIMLRYWNPWEKKDAQGNVIKAPPPEFPFECKGGVCPFVPGGAKQKETNAADAAGDAAADAADVADADVDSTTTTTTSSTTTTTVTATTGAETTAETKKQI